MLPLTRVKYITSAPAHQRGAVLVVSLLILLIMTIIGVTALTTSSLEEKMAGNFRFKDIAFQAAESALRQGEDQFGGTNGAYLTTQPTVSSNGSSGVWDAGAPGDFLTHDTAWWDSNGTALTTMNFGTPSPDPRYVLEQAAFTPDSLNPDDLAKHIGTYSFRITAHAGVGSAQVIVQSTYAKRY